MITRLRLELIHLIEHKFMYNFQNRLNSFCSCGLSIESTSHFLLHCPIFHDNRHTLLSTLNSIDWKILESTDSYSTQTLLFGCTSFDSQTNTLVLNATIDFILSTERFEEPLFLKQTLFFVCNSLIVSQLPTVYFIYLFFHFNLLSSIFLFNLFVLLSTLDFQCLVSFKTRHITSLVFNKNFQTFKRKVQILIFS